MLIFPKIKGFYQKLFIICGSSGYKLDRRNLRLAKNKTPPPGVFSENPLSSLLAVMMVLEDSDEIVINYRRFSEKTPRGGVLFSASLRMLRSNLNSLLPQIIKSF